MEHKLVWLTGFGPFEGAVVNSSWVGVKHMPTRGIKNKYGAVVVKQQLPVKYGFVDYRVPRKWRQLRPDLAVHVGVSGAVDCFTLESQAYKSGYMYPDVDARTPRHGVNRAPGPDVLRTALDVEAICKEFNELKLDGGSLEATVSSDPGRYLCGYIYYTSLSHGGPRSTLFVHVPPDRYTRHQLAAGLNYIVQLALAQI
ncbi:unnamed protein product [Spodoptera littoralis]|uniref:Pyroglutamyl-peptidase I n=1 Tax=Spodoptera littoralis TaxID=7109 RepID=A0A9P0I8D6_SPOLI|nr:unnamed protein product [Spodoptera littoralis]CAH1641922.1 unnamed protein product [Spodoptera littoralis]